MPSLLRSHIRFTTFRQRSVILCVGTIAILFLIWLCKINDGQFLSTTRRVECRKNHVPSYNLNDPTSLDEFHLSNQIRSHRVIRSKETRRFQEWLKIDPIYGLNAPNRCDLNTKLLIVMNSRPKDLEIRRVIRTTWAKRLYDGSLTWVKLVFFWGASTNNGHAKLVEENAKYQDTVSDITFVDSYRNVSYLAMARFKWMTQFCPHAQIIYKADTDNWINLEHLLKRSEQSKGLDGIHGKLYQIGKPSRNQASKWYISSENYPFDRNPRWVCGCGYFIMNDQCQNLVHALIDTASSINIFVWIDDVYVTGILRALAGINVYGLNGVHEYPLESVNACLYSQALSVHYMKPEDFVKLDAQINDPHYMQSCS